jgi:hypothetical protein
VSAEAASQGGEAIARAVGFPTVLTRTYLRHVTAADRLCALAAGLLALAVRFGVSDNPPVMYVAFTCALPILWTPSRVLGGSYDFRAIGVGSDELRKLLTAAITLTAAVTILSHAAKTGVARGRTVIAPPCAALSNLSAGLVRRVVAVGCAYATAERVSLLAAPAPHGSPAAERWQGGDQGSIRQAHGARGPDSAGAGVPSGNHV